MTLLPVNLIYEASCIGSTTIPVLPIPNSLIQYNDTIFVCEGYIINIDTQTIDVHVKLIEDVSPSNPISPPISLN